MISAKLMGGMSNQILQIATIYAHAIKNDFDWGFDLRSYTPLQGFQGTKYADNIFKNVKQIDLDQHAFDYHYREPRHEYDPLPVQDSTLFMGYFQSPHNYCQGVEDQVKKLFHVEPIFSYEYDFTSVHIRRGDFQKFPDTHPLLPIDYYKKAMDIASPPFLFFSDDMDWVKSVFYGAGIHYSPFTSEVEDLRLMAHCKNNIIANSSFSLFAAWLNPNPNKKVVAPHWSRVFGPAGPKAVDMIPPDFIQIEF